MRQLVWIRKGRYYLETECGHYRISRTFTNGVALYTAWRKPPDVPWSPAHQGELLEHFADATRAKDFCQDHHQRIDSIFQELKEGLKTDG